MLDSPVWDIVVNWGTVASATLLLGFLLNQGYVFASQLLRNIPFFAGRLPKSLSSGTKKLVVYLAAVLMTVSFADFSGLLPSGADPDLFVSAILAYATTVFKVAQSIYDRLWQPLISA